MAEKGKTAFRRTVRKPRTASSRQTALYSGVLLSFGSGVCCSVLLLAIFAMILSKTPVPLSFVRLMVCLAAAVGSAVSGHVLARKVGAQFLLCGLGSGVFYLLCLAGATLAAVGSLPWYGANAMLPMALLLGGIFGGALAALRPSR